MNRSDAEPGWISRTTFMDLPERFQVAARELARRGEITIGGNDIGRQARETTSKNVRSHATHG